MAGPKVAVIGAGSVFFTRQVICGMIKSETLRDGTLYLVDVQQDVLDRMVRLGEMLTAEADSPLQIRGTLERREALPGADFVVLAFSDRGVHFRGVDCQASATYGVRMCSGDTIGPGGIFRTLREVPTALAIARDIENLAPDAWVINYVNPTATLGLVLQRHTKLKSFALCDGHHEPYLHRFLAHSVGLTDSEDDCPEDIYRAIDARIGGVNHFTWMIGLTYQGEDMMPKFKATLAERAAAEDGTGHSKAQYNANYALALWDVLGAYPTTIGHAKEYVVHFQGKSVQAPAQKLPPIAVFDHLERAEWVATIWHEIDELLAGTKPLGPLLDETRADKSIDIVETMWRGAGLVQYINVPNSGSIPNLPPDAVLELPCQARMDGVRPLDVGAFPAGLAGLQHQVIDTHDLTVEAAVHCDKTLLRRAMVTDPLTTSIEDADAIMAELFAQEKDALPAAWYQ